MDRYSLLQLLHPWVGIEVEIRSHILHNFQQPNFAKWNVFRVLCFSYDHHYKDFSFIGRFWLYSYVTCKSLFTNQFWGLDELSVTDENFCNDDQFKVRVLHKRCPWYQIVILIDYWVKGWEISVRNINHIHSLKAVYCQNHGTQTSCYLHNFF